MHFDALTLACVADELRHAIAGGRVQQVLQADAHSLAFEIYAAHERHYLLASAHPQESRVHLLSQKARRGVETETPLLLLLRKYARGARLAAVDQPDRTERLLALHFDHPEHGASTLMVEPMGRLGNLLLLDASQRILDCLRRVPAGEHARRVLLPGHPYTAPPPQAKLPPLDDGSADYYDRLGRLGQAGGPLWRALVDGVAGISPSLGREIAWRATAAVDAQANGIAAVALAQALQSIWQLPDPDGWQPGIWLRREAVAGFSAYAVQGETHGVDAFAATASISQAVERYYAERSPARAGAEDSYAAQRRRVAGLLADAQRRVERQLARLAEDEPPPGAAVELRTQAEWLLALSSQVEPGAAVLAVELDDQRLVIGLDPQRTPVEQAQRMFQRAAKLARAAKAIPLRRAALEMDLDFLRQLEVDLALAENQPEIAAVVDELARSGYLTAQQAGRHRPARVLSTQAGQPRRFEAPDGYEILVGRNAGQNERVTFSLAHPRDLWLHVRGAPGSHVLIRCQGKAVGEETVETAAQLAAYFSQLRGERAAAVMVTEKRFVTRVSGGRTGQVHVRNERTVSVPAALPERAQRSGGQ